MTPTQHAHAAHADLDIATTVARSLHLARTERQLESRIALALQCCADAEAHAWEAGLATTCLLYTSPSPRDA